MKEWFVLRRANGDLFSEEIGGKVRIPVWSSAEAVQRFKVHNPELLIFLPTRLTAALAQKSKSRFGADANLEFFLLSDETPAAELDEGTTMNAAEMFAESQAA